MTVTEEELSEIEARVEDVSPLPWGVTGNGTQTAIVCVAHQRTVAVVPGTCTSDAMFLLMARTDVPALCTALREAWDRIALLEEYPLIELTVQMPIVDEPPDEPGNLVGQFYRRGGMQ